MSFNSCDLYMYMFTVFCTTLMVKRLNLNLR